MLAERKKRVKWTLNPCGNLWSQDERKFGQRMLEKMGWKPGNGLGVNEQGITEHIKVRYKSDTKCIGYKENGDKWLEQQSEFESFLAQLSSSHSAATPNITDKSTASLEVRSQQSRARVHYKKFTRGKDMSNYTDKDLACILGVKRKSRCDSDDWEDGKKEGMDESEGGGDVANEEEGRRGLCSGDGEKKKQKKLWRESDGSETKRRKEKYSIDRNAEEETKCDVDTSQQQDMEERERRKKKKKNTEEETKCDVDSSQQQDEERERRKKKKNTEEETKCDVDSSQQQDKEERERRKKKNTEEETKCVGDASQQQDMEERKRMKKKNTEEESKCVVDSSQQQDTEERERRKKKKNTEEETKCDVDTSQQQDMEERERRKKKKKKNTDESITIVECTEYGNKTTKKKKKKEKWLKYDGSSEDSGNNIHVENVNQMEVVESEERNTAKQAKREAKLSELVQCGGAGTLINKEKRRKRKKVSFNTEGEVLQKKHKTEANEVLQIHNDNVENCKQSSDYEENIQDKRGVKRKGEDMQPSTLPTIGEQTDPYSIKNMRPGMFAKLVDPVLVRFKGSNVHKLQGYGRI